MGLSFHRTGSGVLAPVRSEAHEPAIYVPPPVWTNAYSLSFDGSSEYCYGTLAASSPAKAADMAAMSCAAWVKTSTSASNAILSLHTPTAGDRYMMLYHNINKYHARIQTSTALWFHDITGLADGVWHHFAAGWSNSSPPKMWVDGVLVHTGAATVGGVFNDAGKVFTDIGVAYSPNWPSNKFNGKIDECAYFPGVFLSDDDVTAMYNAGAPNDLTDSGSYDTDRSGDLALYYRNGDGTEAAGNVAPYDMAGTGNETDLSWASMDATNYVTDVPT